MVSRWRMSRWGAISVALCWRISGTVCIKSASFSARGLSQLYLVKDKGVGVICQ